MLALPPASPLAAQAQSAAFPSVENASFHQPVFADEDLAVLNNRYPPGGDSGFHAHKRDLFAVIVEPSDSTSQSPGGAPRAAGAVEAGFAAYSPAGVEPRVHRVVNGTGGAFHIVVVELRRAAPAGAAKPRRADAPQYVPITDNPRLSAWRLVLEPGQSAPAITQQDKGVRTVVRGGLLTTSMTGLPDQTLYLRPGDFAVQSAGLTRALRNGGTETIELVEIELK